MTDDSSTSRAKGFRGPAVALVTCLVVLCSQSRVNAQGGQAPAQVTQDDRQGARLHAGIGVTLGDTLSVNMTPYRPGFDPVPSFTVGWAWRISSFDVGVSVTHAPGAHSSTLDLEGRPTRLGDQVGILATLRYRFVDANWGGLYLAIAPGLGISMTTETLRGAMALTEQVLPGDIARSALGFTFQSSTGFYTPLSSHLDFVVEVGAMGTLGALQVGHESLSYDRYRLRIHAGLEWRL